MSRRTKYKPEYCQQVVEHMKLGYSFETFATQIKVAKQTLYTWVEKHSEFKEAKEDGFIHCQFFWEKLGKMGAMGKQPGFNAASYIFNMKNRFGWSDRNELKVSGEGLGDQAENHQLLRAVPRDKLLKLAKQGGK